MRADYWLTVYALLGMGFFENSKPVSHNSLLIISAINESFEIEINEKVYKASFAVIDKGSEYKIIKSKDWNFFAYIPDKTRLAGLIRGKLDRKIHIRNYSKSPESWLTPFVVDSYTDYETEKLFFALLKRFFSIKYYPLSWSKDINSILGIIKRSDLRKLSISNIAEETGFQEELLSSLFKEITGLNLGSYIYNVRLEKLFHLINLGYDIEKSCRESGLPGSASTADFFYRVYGLSLTDLLKQKAMIGFSIGDLYRLYGFEYLIN